MRWKVKEIELDEDGFVWLVGTERTAKRSLADILFRREKYPHEVLLLAVFMSTGCSPMHCIDNEYADRDELINRLDSTFKPVKDSKA